MAKFNVYYIFFTQQLPTLVEDCSIEQIEQAPPQVICSNGQPYNNNYIKKAIDTRNGPRKTVPKNSEMNLPVNGPGIVERPESPSPDYSNSPSPTPESETQTVRKHNLNNFYILT